MDESRGSYRNCKRNVSSWTASLLATFYLSCHGAGAIVSPISRGTTGNIRTNMAAVVPGAQKHIGLQAANIDESHSSTASGSHSTRFIAPSISVHLKALALIALMVQNSALTVSMRMTRMRSNPAQLMYISSTAVVLSEVTKFLVSCIIFALQRISRSTRPTAARSAPVDRGGVEGTAADLHDATDSGLSLSVPDSRRISSTAFQMRQALKQFFDAKAMLKISLPAGLYVIQNNLQYIATTNLPAQVYQVLIQMKLISTALCAKAFLGKAQSIGQWMSIAALGVGISLVQLSFRSGKLVSAENVNLYVGLIAVGLSSATSGFAAVSVESAVKEKNAPLWLKNMQMAFMGTIIALISCAVKDGPAVLKNGFFSGYHPMVLGVVAIHAVGGLIISVVVKYTDSIVKGFATAGSILLSALASSLVLNEAKMTAQFFVGAAIVCKSALVYSLCSGKKPADVQSLALPADAPVMVPAVIEVGGLSYPRGTVKDERELHPIDSDEWMEQQQLGLIAAAAVHAEDAHSSMNIEGLHDS